MFFRKLFSKPEVNSGEQLVQTTNLRVETSTDHIRRIIRSEQLRAKLNSEAESFDEANDFEFEEEDGETWLSPYENEFEPEPESGDGRSPSDTAVDPPPVDNTGGNDEPAT